MSKRKVVITFQTITPPDDWEEVEAIDWPMETGIEEEISVSSVREAIKTLKDKGCVEEGNVKDYYTPDEEFDYETGARTTYGCHLHGFSKKEMKRVQKEMQSRW